MKRGFDWVFLACFILIAVTSGCGGGSWSPGDDLPSWMDHIANRMPVKNINASSIQGTGYDSTNRTFTFNDGTYEVDVDGFLPKSLPLRMDNGLRVEVTYTPKQGSTISFTMDQNNRSFRLPLRPGTGTLHMVGTPVPPSPECFVRFDSGT